MIQSEDVTERSPIVILKRFNLTGKVAIVTGAGRGIGKAIALGLGEAGASVVCAARTEEEIQAVASSVREGGSNALAVPTDVTQEADLERLVDETLRRFSRIDILVNNAGGSLPTLALYTTKESFEEAFSFNVSSTFELSKKCVLPMLKNDTGGVLLNISSALSHVMDSGFVAYGTAKAALNQMTRLLACEFAPKIRANAIAVGAIETDALNLVLSDETMRKKMIDRTPMARLGQPEDIAAAALYLTSDASSWVTGKVFEVDGGTETTNWPMPFSALDNLPE